MHATNNDLQQILSLAPDWQPIWQRLENDGIAAGATGTELGKTCAQMCALFSTVGAKSIFQKFRENAKAANILCKPIRDFYFTPMAAKMFRTSANLRRFIGDKRFTSDECKSLQLSMAVEVAVKLDAALNRHLKEERADGFKVLLPAYIQSSVNNAVIDYIKQESFWDKQTQNDSYTDGEEESPIERAADDFSLIPDQLILSAEKAQHLNDLRKHLVNLLGNTKQSDAAYNSLSAVDCVFGLGLTSYSKLGHEMTMRECCEALKLDGETQARKIARCQVLLDKGMNKIRDSLRDNLPSMISCWQQEINVNAASRRDLNHQLDLTEGEIERLIISRQYLQLEQLVDRLVLKEERLALLKEKGAVAAFIPVDANSATVRDLIDILGLPKNVAQNIANQRPFERFEQMLRTKLLNEQQLNKMILRGAVLRVSGAVDARVDLNQCLEQDFGKLGLVPEKVRLLMRGRPFATWVELEEFLPCDETSWFILRNNFRLGIKSS